MYIENIPISLDTLVGNILGCIQVPPPGGPQVRFSIGAGDRQALQPPLSPTLPVTHSTVHLLFQELGLPYAVDNRTRFTAVYVVLITRGRYFFFRDQKRAGIILRRNDRAENFISVTKLQPINGRLSRSHCLNVSV